MPLKVLQRLSLKTRVTFFTLAIFLISIWALSFYASQVLREDMQRLLGEQQFSTATFVANEVNDELKARINSLELIAHAIDASLLDKPAALQKFIEQRFVLHSLFNGGIFVTRLDGSAVASVPLSAGRFGVNFMERDHIAAALKEGKSTVSKPVIGKLLRVPVVSVAAPIRDSQGKIIGALAGVIDLSKSNFLDMITEHRYGKTGGYLLNAPQYRLVVTATDKRRTMEALPAPGVNPSIDRFINGYEGSAIAVTPLGVEVLASAKSVPVAGWYVAALLPTEEAFAPIRAMQKRILLATTILTLLAGVLIWWLLRRQLSPMLAAVKNLSALSDSKSPPQSLPIVRQDEIGELIGGFNHLLEILRQREDGLKESEARFRNMADQAPALIWMADTQNAGTWYNNHWLEYTGRSMEQELGFGWIEGMHPDDRQRCATFCQTAFDGRQKFDMEFRLRRADGTYRWIADTGAPRFDERGNFLGYIGYGWDITERKQAEVKTANSLSLLNATLESTHDAILVVDLNNKWVLHNQRFIDLWNITGEILAAKDDYAALSYVRGQLEDADGFMGRVHELYDSPEAHSFDTIKFKDGRIIERYSIPQLIEGKVAGRVWSFRDVTERRQAEAKLAESEARLRAIIENEPECIKIVDAQGRLVQMNPAGLAMIEADTLEQVTGRPVLNVIAPEYRRAFADMHQRVLAGETMQMEFEVLGLKGGRRWLETHAVPMQDQGRVVHLAVTRDISGRKQAETALQALNETLEHRVQDETSKNMEQERLLIQQSRLAAMGEMIGNIAHQWRQPINALTLLLTNIKDAYEYNDLTKEYLDKEVSVGQELIQKMSVTIDDFRNFFKPNKEKQRFIACDGVEEAVKLVSHAFISNNIEITREKSAEPCTVFGFPNEFAQVVLNVLTNAKEAIIARKIAGKVHIKVERGENAATVMIRDNGGGIPKEILGKVFDPYFTTKAAGTGIGLYMSKMILDNMGGDLAIRNVEGGAEVLISLPLDMSFSALPAPALKP